MRGMEILDKLPGGKSFQAEYDKAGYKEPPEAYGAFAFAAMQLILDKIEAVGPDRAKVTAALGDVKNYDSIIGPVTFDDHGQKAKAADVVGLFPDFGSMLLSDIVPGGITSWV